MTGHGGNIYRFAEESGLPEMKVIDFSASINPLGVPKTAKAEIRKTTCRLPHYPDPDVKKLRAEIARHLDIGQRSIICGNGSTELIYLTVRALRPGRVIIPAPTFSEYEKACMVSNKLRVTRQELCKDNAFDIDTDGFIEAIEQQSSGTAERQGENATELLRYGSDAPFNLAFLCNPNNPTGRLIRKNDMLKIAGAAKEYKCYLVVDEAFIDFIPDESVVNAVEMNPYLIVLRSMTKFYALSGLRIGYGVFPSSIIERIKKHKEPWTVNSLAQSAGVAAFNDKAYKKETFKIIRLEKLFMENEFKKLNIDYIPSSANFYMLRLHNAEVAISSLKHRGILVRDCSNFTGLDGSYIRVAVKSRRHNLLLIRELSRLCRA